MHLFARTGKHTSISNGTGVALGSALSPVLLHSFPVEITFQAALTHQKPAAGSADMTYSCVLAIDLKIPFKNGIIDLESNCHPADLICQPQYFT